MTTAEFIELLKLADPQGDSHIRINGKEVPINIHKLPGYYDGGYSYIDDIGNFVYSKENSKVDVIMLDIYDYVENLIDDNENITWEEVKNKFHFKLVSSTEHNIATMDTILANVKKDFLHIKKRNKSI